MGRRGGDIEIGGEAQRGAERHREVVAVKQAVPQSLIVDKHQAGYLGSE